MSSAVSYNRLERYQDPQQKELHYGKTTMMEYRGLSQLHGADQIPAMGMDQVLQLLGVELELGKEAYQLLAQRGLGAVRI
jgi:hypothetical protein